MDINKINFKYDKRDIINDTLSRINKLINEEKYIQKIINQTQLPYIFTNSPIPIEYTYTKQ
jgi:glutaredoxin